MVLVQVVLVMFRRIYLSLILISSFALCSFRYDAQNIDEVINTLKTSINIQNATQFSEYFDNTIDITVSNSHSVYTRSHAIILINDFYHKNQPVSFKVDYKGSSPLSDAQYVIGTTNTQNGTFRIYLYLKNKGGKFVIQEMKIAR